jgi:hypothetical protein
VLELTEPPLNVATCSTVLHADDAQRLIVTKSLPFSVLKDEKDRLIPAVEAMSHMQLASMA